MIYRFKDLWVYQVSNILKNLLKKKRFLLRTSNGNGSINGIHGYFDRFKLAYKWRSYEVRLLCLKIYVGCNENKIKNSWSRTLIGNVNLYLTWNILFKWRFKHQCLWGLNHEGINLIFKCVMNYHSKCTSKGSKERYMGLGSESWTSKNLLEG